VYSMGRQHKDMPVRLNRNHLASHVFVTGSTGKGKSNAIYGLLDRLCPEDGGDMRFLVIEPIKGEYKTVFGGRRDVSVYGTNPYKTPLLRMNPFSFPGDIHVLEHIDRLVEIFNACWPMYAAMPAILKKAVENAYVRVGWSLRRSVCLPLRFPTFAVLLDELPRVIDGTSYSKDTGSDYKGALMTRVSSLAEGTYDQIFNNGDIPGEELFDGCVIADLSRMGSAETKALMMGILLLKLQEYRMANAAEGNAALRHVTVLEEAHCLLRRTSFEQGQESANLLGKSVEMLSNSIAEMRTYGEGFIIADQSPGLLDMSAIRNTNTKILLGLPEAQDRELAGRAAGMNDDQISELAKLETGVAAVYQSGWAQPLLCKITHFEDKHKRPFVFKPERAGDDSVRRFYALALGCEDAEPLTAEDADALRSWRDRQLTDMPTLALIDAVLASRALSLAQRQILAYNLLCGKRAALYLAQEASAEKIQTFLADQMCVSPEDALTQRAFRLVMEEIHALLEDGGDKDKVEQILRVEGYR
ncbi:MAG: DUF87 domain-containing protein, partial [Firmicutes bacterium]|nr:DUF87 domain-containing protein [Bacillota bacterium]